MKISKIPQNNVRRLFLPQSIFRFLGTNNKLLELKLLNGQLYFILNTKNFVFLAMCTIYIWNQIIKMNMIFFAINIVGTWENAKCLIN